MKHLFPLLLFLFCSTVCAQEKMIHSRVVDAKTNEPLPYAQIYVSVGKGTLTNDEGNFSIKVNRNDTLRISYVGYEKIFVVAREIKDAIKLRPMSKVLGEVKVEGHYDYMGKIVKKLNASYRKGKKEECRYFMRQTNITDENTQMVEAYVEANNAVCLRNMVFLTGRHYRDESFSEYNKGVADMLWFSNAHSTLSLGPMMKGEHIWKNCFTPFNPVPGQLTGYAYKTRYEVNTEYIQAGDGSEQLRIRLVALETQNRERMLAGTLYVDAKTLDLISFKGEMVNYLVQYGKSVYNVPQPAKLHIDISYKQEDGITKVASMATNLIAQQIQCKTILYNVDGMDLDLKTDGEKSVNMLEAIKKAGYNAELWKNPIIKRTAEEEELAESE